MKIKSILILWLAVCAVNLSVDAQTKSKPLSPRFNNAAKVKTTNQSKTGAQRTEAARKYTKVGHEFDRKLKGQYTEGKSSVRGRNSKARLTDVKSRKQVRPDILTNQRRPFEIKPNSKSGVSRGKTQLKKYENATGRRGALIVYDRTTGKHQFKRTSLRKWEQRERSLKTNERARERKVREIRRPVF